MTLLAIIGPESGTDVTAMSSVHFTTEAATPAPEETAPKKTHLLQQKQQQAAIKTGCRSSPATKRCQTASLVQHS